ncbi:MAG TPA: succinylglutamate desuccinylase/aspartoacylase family protein [Aggregatilineaceae bacterium]|nr:succinylglutamate desuccinylase/aspartoacylase family protein [Aggregatilineaceae bacterium]
MASYIRIGTAHNEPGKIVCGTFEGVPLPTGGMDSFPVIVAQGKSGDGPVLWLTANIHGTEYDGLAVIHDLLTPDLLPNLTGTIVAIPTLSPAGLRDGERSPYYLHGKDPNRIFPDLPGLEELAGLEPSSALELAYARLFERIDATANYLIDLHNYGIRSIPFAFRDPIFYREPRDRPVATKLQITVGDMLGALGLTTVNEFPSDKYLKSNLHRSVSGSALNRARIPAITIEIGGERTVNTLHVQAVITGIRNVMRWAGMLPGPAEPMPNVPVIKPGYPVRRTSHPHVSEACIVHYLVQPGDKLKAGDPVARMVDIYGRPAGTDGGLLRTSFDGFVLGLFSRIAFYPNEAILGLAVRDDSELVIQLPER